MKNEEQTKCTERINGISCRGAVVRDERISRLEHSLKHRKYTCLKCGSSWKARSSLVNN